MTSCTARVLCYTAIVNTLPDHEEKYTLLDTLEKLRTQSENAEMFAHPVNPHIENKLFTDPRFSDELDNYLSYEKEMNDVTNQIADLLASLGDKDRKTIKTQLEAINDPTVILSLEQAIQLGITIADNIEQNSKKIASDKTRKKTA